jgi:NAD(P)-dependent dehydrogenase (short-subunit alcohol dehydrogenase family)
MKLFDLTGRAAIVTGGNGGIGLGMATSLRDAGASVVIAGRNKEKAQKPRRRLASAPAPSKSMLPMKPRFVAWWIRQCTHSVAWTS